MRRPSRRPSRGAAGEPTLLADPGGVDLEPAIVGEVGGRVAVDIDNIGFFPTSVSSIRLGGAHPDDFVVQEQSCTNRALNPDASCAIEVEFRPKGVGYRSALLLVVRAVRSVHRRRTRRVRALQPDVRDDRADDR